MIHGESCEGSFWPMVSYAQASGNDAVCKAIILKKLNEPNSPDVAEVTQQNDGITNRVVQVGPHAWTVAKLLQVKTQNGELVTLTMLVKEWRGRNPPLDL